LVYSVITPILALKHDTLSANAPLAKAPALVAAAAAATSAPREPKSLDTTLATNGANKDVAGVDAPKDEKKDKETKSRSQSRKRSSIFGSLLGKKEEKDEQKEVKKEEKAEKKVEKEELKEEKKEEAKATHEPSAVAEAGVAAAGAAGKIPLPVIWHRLIICSPCSGHRCRRKETGQERGWKYNSNS
jgi:hypothetical protein